MELFLYGEFTSKSEGVCYSFQRDQEHKYQGKFGFNERYTRVITGAFDVLRRSSCCHGNHDIFLQELSLLTKW